MNRYTFRRHKRGPGGFRTWEYEYVNIKSTELPKIPASYELFTITKL